MVGWIGTFMQVTSAVSSLLGLIREVSDVVEKEIPSGGGDVKHQGVMQTVAAVLDATDGVMEDGTAADPKLRQAILSAASGATNAMVALRNTSGKYTHHSTITAPVEETVTF